MRLAMVLLAALWTMTLSSATALTAPPPSADGASEQPRTQRGTRAITHVESYVSVEPIIAAVQAHNSLRGILHIEFGLEAPRSQTRREIAEAMPRLRDSYASAISVYTGMNYRYGDVPDVERIAAMLQSATDQVIGPEKADVLLAMVIIHGR